jgi:ketosteroid isomerase-like protein
MEIWQEFSFQPEEFIDAGEQVIVRVRARGRARASGVEVENVRFHVYGFREGKVASLELFVDEAAARAAAS